MRNKNLLYLASGGIVPEYRELKFGKLIFIDRTKKQISFADDRFEFLHGDALTAVDELITRDFKIHYLVSLNEGLSGGGGNYPILSDFLIGYLSPILADELILICDPSYYKQIGMKLHIEWGFECSPVDIADQAYIQPFIFSNKKKDSGNEDYGKVFRLKRNRIKKSYAFQSGGTNFNVVYGSVWDEVKELDLIGINLLSKHSFRNFKRPFNLTIDEFFIGKGVYNLNNKSINEVIEFARINGRKHLGLGPWMDGKYSDVFNYLKENRLEGIESLTFFNLRKKDFARFCIGAKENGAVEL